MALGMNFNPSAVLAHYNLNAADRDISTTIERLSSGLRLTRTADDPASMTLANQLRHHLSGVVQSSENVEESIAMIRTGEGSMDEIGSLLTRMRALALGAANLGVTDQNQLDAYQQELNEAVGSINAIANNSSFGSIKLLNGDLADSKLSPDALAFYTHVQHDDTVLINGIKDKSTISINPPSANLSRSSVEVTFAGAPNQDSPINGQTQVGTATPLNVVGETISINGPRGKLDIALSASTTIRQLTGMINAQSDALGVLANYDETTGALHIESLQYGDSALSIESTDVNATGIGLLDSDATSTLPLGNSFVTAAANQTMNVDYVDENGLSQTAILTQDSTTDDGRTFSGNGFSVTVKDTSNPSGTKSINAFISAAPSVQTANRVSSTAIQNGALSNQRVTLEMKDMRSGALGHAAAGNFSGFNSIQDLLDDDALSNGNAQDALRVIDAAINDVSSERGRLGALESTNLESSLSATRISIENLTQSESTLRDADFAQESANYAQQNIRYQAAISMLAQANQLPQSVLQLLS